MSLTQFVQPTSPVRHTSISPAPSCRIPITKAIQLWIRGRFAPQPEADGFRSAAPVRLVPIVTGRCVRPERLLTSDLTNAEWEHVEECAHCRNSMVRMQESAEPRLQKLYRRARLTLHDWNPILQFVTMIVILASVGWSIHQVRIISRAASRTASAPRLQAPVPPSLSPAAVVPAAATMPPPIQPAAIDPRDELAQKIGAKLSWPWTSCAVGPDVINRWLGQGSKRRQIDNDLQLIEKSIPKKGTLRKQAAKPWCDGLGQGSSALAQEARRQAQPLQRGKAR